MRLVEPLRNQLVLFFRLLKNFLQQTNFSGVSGRVLFSDGERYLPTVEIKQHFPSRVVTVGSVHPNIKGQCGNNRRCLAINEMSIYWPQGIVPSDGRPGDSLSFVLMGPLHEAIMLSRGMV